jgi:hypothetical protein
VYDLLIFYSNEELNMSRQERAFIGFLLGAAGLAALQGYTNRQAAALGIPHVIAGLLVAAMAHEIGPA